MAVFVQLPGVIQADFISLFPGNGNFYAADYFLAAVKQKIPFPESSYQRREPLADFHRSGFLQFKFMVVVTVFHTSFPVTVVIIQPLPAIAYPPRVNILQKAGVVPCGAAGNKFLRPLIFPFPVRGGNLQPLPLIRAVPDAVYKPLIVNMDGYHIFSLTKRAANLIPVVIVPERIARGRALPDKNTVYPHLVIVVGSDVKHCLPVSLHHALIHIKNMAYKHVVIFWLVRRRLMRCRLPFRTHIIKRSATILFGAEPFSILYHFSALAFLFPFHFNYPFFLLKTLHIS